MSENDTKQILAERGKTHGDFTHQAYASQQLKATLHRVCRIDVNHYHPVGPAMAECADMILHKLSRAFTGDPLVEDHWRDIAGYATLVADRVRQYNQRQAQQLAAIQQIQKEEAQHVNRPSDGKRDSQPTPDSGGSVADRRDSGQAPGPGPTDQQSGIPHTPTRGPIGSAELDEFVRDLTAIGFRVHVIGFD